MSTIRYKPPSDRAVLRWGLAAIGPPVKRRPDSKSVVINMGALDLFPQLRSSNRWTPNHAWNDRDGIPCREPLTAPVGTSLTAPIAEGCRHVDAQLRAPALGGNCAHERPTPSYPACKFAEFAGNRGMPVPNYLSSVGHIRRSDRQAEGASWPHLATEVVSIRGRNPGTQATGAGEQAGESVLCQTGWQQPSTKRWFLLSGSNISAGVLDLASPQFAAAPPRPGARIKTLDALPPRPASPSVMPPPAAHSIHDGVLTHPTPYARLPAL